MSSSATYIAALQACVEKYPVLGSIVKNGDTEKPWYELVSSVQIKDHILIQDELKLSTSDSSVELQTIERLLPLSLERCWAKETSDIPAWRILIHPINANDSRSQRCFVAFSFGHAIADGVAGPQFHRTFLQALRQKTTGELTATVTPEGPLPPPFDTPERIKISWSYLLPPLLGVILPNFLCDLFGLHAGVGQIDDGTWLGTPIFFDPKTSKPDYKLFEIEADLLQKCLGVCKKHNTKLTGLLHQVILRALSRNTPATSKSSNFVAGTAANMRRSAGISEEEMGLYVTGCYSKFDRQDNQGPLSEEEWAQTRRTTEELGEAAVRLDNQPIGLLRYAPSMRGYMLGKMGTKRDCSYEISNLTTFTDPGSANEGDEGHAGVRIEKMIFSQPMHVNASPLVFNLVSVKGGSLVCSVGWQVGSTGFAGEEERSFVERVCETIKVELERLE